jgi:16S rRNA processing protein RimM
LIDLLVVGRIGKAHGLRGELYVDLITDRTERLTPGSVLYVKGRALTVRTAKPQQTRWLVTFEEVADRNAAEALTNLEIEAPPIDDPDAVWVHELIGSRVVERDGTDRGRCVGVVANPAHDLLELESGALVPSIFVLSCEDGVTTIDPPAGLFEVFEEG